MYLVINDYELIYLVQCYQDGVALEMMFSKYENMIWKNMSLYDVNPKDRDDIFQDCLILLNKAINIFNESKGKTFTRYFELICKREIIHKKKRIPDYYLMDRPELIPGQTLMCLEEEKEFDVYFKTNLGKNVFRLYFMEKKKINVVSQILGICDKQVYNCVFRIKKKLKDLL